MRPMKRAASVAYRLEVSSRARPVVQHERNRVVSDAHREYVARPAGLSYHEVVSFDIDDGAAARVGDRREGGSAGAELLGESE